MQNVADLDLPYLEYTNPALAADPYPYFEEARKKHPFLARTDLGIVVTEYQAMRDLFGRESGIGILEVRQVEIGHILHCRSSRAPGPQPAHY